MQALWNRLRALWTGQSLTRRILFGLLALLIVIITAATYDQVATKDMVILESNLDPSETSAYVAKLTTAKITNQVDSTATRISVAKQDLPKARVALAEGGVSSKMKGLEIIDEGGLTTTPFVQGINYLRGLQGELARSITKVESVQSARVHIARPEPTPFIRDQKPVTASVILTMKPGKSLNKLQSAGIVGLVSRAIEGLKSENVFLIDSNGRQLSNNRSPEETGAPPDQMEYRKELEDYLATKAQTLLAAHLGAGRAIVTVSADIDYQKVKEKSKEFSQPGVVLAERTQNSKSTGGSGSRGAAGAASNVSRAGGTSGGGGGTSNDETAATDYLVSTTEREMEKKMATVSRLSIAAMVDLSPDEADEAKKLISAIDAQDIIKQAIGFKTGRDEIKVSDVRLGSASLVPPETESATAVLIDKTAAIVTMIRNGALALTALIVLAMLSMLFLRRGKKAGQTADAATPAQPPAPTEAELEKQREDQRRKEIEEFVELARRDPDAVATMILNMLGGAA